MRGSDPDAAIYWLARMLEAGEDPRFIARRIVICRHAKTSATPIRRPWSWPRRRCKRVEFVGLPECQLAAGAGGHLHRLAPKSNASTMAIGAAREDVRDGPDACRCRSTCATPTTAAPKNSATAKDYKYSHDYEGGWVEQEYLPEERRYYEPTDRGYEAVLRQRLAESREKRLAPTPSRRSE